MSGIRKFLFQVVWMNLGNIVLCILLSLQLSLFAQNYTQSIKGTIQENESLIPVQAAEIILLNHHPLLISFSDEGGNFHISNVPLGRQSLLVRHLNYEQYSLHEIWISSGKEVYLDIKLKEKIYQTSEVIITDTKRDPRNEMLVLSTHRFDPTQFKAFAGNLGDPSRMLARVAGVQNPNDIRNDLVVRGNSPVGVLWRLEGMDIYAPNHFATAGNTGGSVNILNPFTLASSDFITGAFSAEYGNAYSAIFDVALRKGNSDRHEGRIRTNMIDLEVGFEGPVSKKNKSSYLFAYRRNNLDLAFKLIPDLREYLKSVPNIQDATVKIHFPTKNGWISAFGLGGSSNLSIRNSLNNPRGSIFNSRTFSSGISYFRFIGKKSYLKSVIGISHLNTHNRQFRTNSQDSLIVTGLRNSGSRYAASILFNSKIKPKHTWRLGFTLQKTTATVENDLRSKAQAPLFYYYIRERFMQLQAHTQWKYAVNPKLRIHSGLHFLYLGLNNSLSLEPRFSLKWTPSTLHSVAVAFGLYSQTQPTSLYLSGRSFFRSNGEIYYSTPNKNLDLSRSRHYILSYKTTSIPKVLTKIELYLQQHYSIPDFRDNRNFNSFSGLNFGYDFGDLFFWNNLTYDNTGKGTSYGIELSLEKPLSNRYYLSMNGSLYNSTYQGFMDVVRNTAFNGNYSFNLLAGKEFEVNTYKKHLLACHLSVTGAGGRRFTPLDENALIEGRIVEDQKRAFEGQYKDYFRTDIKLTYQQNFQHFSHEISLDIRNVLNTKNVLYKEFKLGNQQYETTYQLPILPLVGYQIDF